MSVYDSIDSELRMASKALKFAQDTLADYIRTNQLAKAVEWQRNVEVRTEHVASLRRLQIWRDEDEPRRTDKTG